MGNLIDKIKSYITPSTPPSEDSLQELQTKTQNLEQQAESAETEAKLLVRVAKAKKRIRIARKSNIRPIYIIIGLVILGIIILVISRGC